MRGIMVVLLGVAFSLAALNAGDNPKSRALAPHPLDAVFSKEDAESVNKALLRCPRYKKAVAEALKIKKAEEKRYKDHPGLIGATPAQSARLKFLEVLQGED